MLNFPVVNLPFELVELLKTNMANNEGKEKIIFSIVNKNTALVQLLEDLFAEFDSQKRLPQVLKKINWNTFRDHFSSIYVYHAVHGKYPSKSQMNLINDIQNFEDRLENVTQKSHSRSFLLGLYLKIMQIQFRKEGQSHNANFLEIPDEVFEIINLSSAKTEKIDWLVLIIWQLSQILPKGTLKNEIKKNNTYMNIYQTLSAGEQNLFLRNCLAYGCSINETELFLNDKV
ncbi:MAG: hypothetical protein JNM93_13555 [Bacteriovoracaceae bacterium]|nr:hypothetical protein [Bacteriovoracaceae bacterium]